MPTPPERCGRSDRVVLDGVPRVGYYFDTQKHEDSKTRCPEDVPFPSCLRACLEYLGDGLGCRQVGQCSADWKLGCGYAHLMGVTGSAFQLTWADGWHPDNVASWLIGNGPAEIFRRGFAAIGYEYETLRHGDLRQRATTTTR